MEATLSELRRNGFLNHDELAAELMRRHGLRPMAAYRAVADLTAQQAADRLRWYHDITPGELLQLESGVAGGPALSAGILAALAQIYGTQLQNLVDYRDWQRLPAADRLLVDGLPDPGRQPGQNLTALLVGQATAVLAIAAGLIYAAGALPLGLKLYFIGDSWRAVLGSLPRDIVLANSVSTLAPAFAAAAVIYAACATWAASKRGRKTRQKLAKHKYLRGLALTLIAILCAAALALLISPGLLTLTGHHFSGMHLRHEYYIFLVLIGIDLAVVGLAWGGLTLVRRSSQQQTARYVLSAAMVALALVPFFAAVNASFPLPPVLLCGPSFSVPSFKLRPPDTRAISGNLIGNSGQWSFIVQTTHKNGRPYGSFITMVPVSQVRLEVIGSGTCGDLATPAKGP